MSQKAVSIAHTTFPLYTIRMVGDSHFLVAGGGGSARTGIANAIEIYELKDDQGKCVANRINHFETEERAVMNCAVAPKCQNNSYNLATGQDEKCQLYTLRQKIVALKPHSQGTNDGDVGVRKRKSNLTKAKDYDNAVKTTIFEIEKLDSKTTDFSKDEGFQKCVVFSPDEKTILTGGVDGCVRVWKHPSLEKCFEIKSHKNEIDDLDVSPPGNTICTVSKDNKGFIWNAKDGSKKAELVWNFKTDGKYRMRSCRFGKIEGKTEGYKLFTSHIPVVRGTKSSRCYITKWNTTNYRPEKVQNTGNEVSSALAISDDGTYLGLGCLSGCVSVYISFSLQKLYHVKQAHGIFVTGLEFTPKSSESITGDNDFTLLSISADNQIKIHQQAPRGILPSLFYQLKLGLTTWLLAKMFLARQEQAMYSPLWVIVGTIVLSYLAFWVLSVL